MVRFFASKIKKTFFPDQYNHNEATKNSYHAQKIRNQLFRVFITYLGFNSQTTYRAWMIRIKHFIWDLYDVRNMGKIPEQFWNV